MDPEFEKNERNLEFLMYSTGFEPPRISEEIKSPGLFFEHLKPEESHIQHITIPTSEIYGAQALHTGKKNRQKDEILKLNSSESNSFGQTPLIALKKMYQESYISSIPSEKFKSRAKLKKMTEFILSSTVQQSQFMPTPVFPQFSLNSPAFSGAQLMSPEAITVDRLPEIAVPIVEFIEATRPHIVIGCDRGGRLISVTVQAVWSKLHPDEKFPTLDAKTHFARVSKSEDPEVVQDKIDDIVRQSKRLGKMNGVELADGEQLRVLFIDDWIVGGGTVRLAERVMKKHGAKVDFAVMCGEGGSVSGTTTMNSFVSWHDKPEQIGVNYLSTMQSIGEGKFRQAQEAIAVRDPAATRNRDRIYAAVKLLGTGIKPPVVVEDEIDMSDFEAEFELLAA